MAASHLPARDPNRSHLPTCPGLHCAEGTGHPGPGTGLGKQLVHSFRVNGLGVPCGWPGWGTYYASVALGLARVLRM